MFVIIIGSIVSLIGTMIGASLGILVKSPSKRFLGTIVGFAAGLMLAIVVFDLIPEALASWNFANTMIFCIMGIAAVTVLDNIADKAKIGYDVHKKVALMAAIGLALHNLPEGVVMGCGFLAGKAIGIEMAVIISIHDIPEGIAVAAPLMASRIRPMKILLYSFITAFPTAVGVWIGGYVGSISPNVLGASLSFASGIMLYIVCGEMIPESSRLWNGIISTIGTLSGVMLGLVITKVI